MPHLALQSAAEVRCNRALQRHSRRLLCSQPFTSLLPVSEFHVLCLPIPPPERGRPDSWEAVGGFKTSFANLREVLSHEVVLHEFDAETDKLTRALPWIGPVEAGKVFLVRGEWNIPFIKEASEFPRGANDDQVDGVSGAYIMLKGQKPVWLV